MRSDDMMTVSFTMLSIPGRWWMQKRCARRVMRRRIHTDMCEPWVA